MGRLPKKNIIHINQHVIRRNTKTGERNPVITCKTYNTNEYANKVIIEDKNGDEVATIIYSPDKPLSCGARVWIETRNNIKFIKDIE
jgi:hypothetical protein